MPSRIDWTTNAAQERQAARPRTGDNPSTLPRSPSSFPSPAAAPEAAPDAAPHTAPDLLYLVAFYRERTDYYADLLWKARAKIVALERDIKRRDA